MRLFLVVFLSGAIFGSEIEKWLIKNSTFTKKQITTLAKLIKDSAIEGFPVEYLQQRIKEGVAKKAGYEAIYLLLCKKIENLKDSKALLHEFRLKKNDYNLILLAELLERGLKKANMVEISSFVVKSEQLLELSKMYIILKRNSIPEKEVMRLITSIARNEVKNEKIFQITKLIIRNKEIDLKKLFKIVLSGIEERKSVKWMENEIKRHLRKKIMEEIEVERIERR